MLNPYSMGYQPYYFIQAPGSTYPPFVFHDQTPLLFASFLHHNSQQNGPSAPPAAPVPSELESGSSVTPNKAKPVPVPVLGEINSQKGYIIKEKIIKKPANRPATYLTEKKYYLSQTLAEESNSNRRLRPRKLKKRNHEGLKSGVHPGQLSPKEKLRDFVTKGDIGSNQYMEQSFKKREDEGSSPSIGGGECQGDASQEKGEK